MTGGSIPRLPRLCALVVALAALTSIACRAAHANGPSVAVGGASPSEAPGAGQVRLGDGFTTAAGGAIEIPVLVKAPPEAGQLELVIDYDELILGYAWFRSAGSEWTVEKAYPYGPRRMMFVLDRTARPADAVADGEVAALVAVFYTKDSPGGPMPFRHRAPLTLGIDRAGYSPYTRFLALLPGGRRQPIPTWSVPGSATVYYTGGVEVGGGGMTPVPQDVRLPLYLTDLEGGTRTYTIGIDYDEVFLNARGVEGRSPPLDASHVETQASSARPGRLVFQLHLARPPAGPYARLHVADLLFQFRGGAVPDTALLVTPAILEGAAAERDPEAAAGDGNGGGRLGSSAGEIRLLPALFTRGNVDGSFAVDARDVVAILRAIFGGDDRLDCLDAADVNDSGHVEVGDAVHLLNYLYRGGPSPAAPFPEAGGDATSDGLGCEASLAAFVPDER